MKAEANLAGTRTHVGFKTATHALSCEKQSTSIGGHPLRSLEIWK
jgi:hypothetical protein